MGPHAVSVSEAAEALGIPASAVEALGAVGYLRLDADGAVPVSELKSFQARNAADAGDTMAELLADMTGADVGAEEILDLLEQRVKDMADRTADIVSTAFPEVAQWSRAERDHFVDQTMQRLEAIVALTRAAGAGDDLLEELADAGGAAAFAGAPLPQVLASLRISRDLLVQSAVAAADELGRQWGLALSIVLTRILPVLDRLTDTVARGWWSAVLVREQEAYVRYEHMVEHSANGVYEVDLDGCVQYSNAMFARLCGHDADRMADRDLAELLPPADPATGIDVYRTPTASEWRPLRVLRADGVEREFHLQVTARTRESRIVGFDGIVRDITTERALERQKNDFLALITRELRQPLTTVLGLGAALELHADELPRDRIVSMGRSIHRQSERIARLADDLHDISLVRADNLTVSLRSVDLARTCTTAVRMLNLAGPDIGGVALDVPAGLVVSADSRRLEQVIAHLVENGLRHGAPPVTVTARLIRSRCHDAPGVAPTPADTPGTVRLEVTDAGAGVPPADVDGLFASLRPSVGDDRLRDRPSGLGLALAGSLVEAMGGRIRYEPVDAGGARFVVDLPAASMDKVLPGR